MFANRIKKLAPQLDKNFPSSAAVYRSNRYSLREIAYIRTSSKGIIFFVLTADRAE